VKGIADTGFLVAFANRNDRHHAWAIGLSTEITDPLLTCEAVLAETAFHLGGAAVVLEMLESGLVSLAFDLESNRAQVASLAARYADRSPDLADLCLVRMSEMHPRHKVLTVDQDFLVYRRNRREVIPVLLPVRR
jgi:predicted nucleic acid-binding protein